MHLVGISKPTRCHQLLNLKAPIASWDQNMHSYVRNDRFDVLDTNSIILNTQGLRSIGLNKIELNVTTFMNHACI